MIFRGNILQAFVNAACDMDNGTRTAPRVIIQFIN